MPVFPVLPVTFPRGFALREPKVPFPGGCQGHPAPPIHLWFVYPGRRIVLTGGFPTYLSGRDRGHVAARCCRCRTNIFSQSGTPGAHSARGAAARSLTGASAWGPSRILALVLRSKIGGLPRNKDPRRAPAPRVLNRQIFLWQRTISPPENNNTVVVITGAIDFTAQGALFE